jgi:cell division protease FtsH
MHQPSRKQDRTSREKPQDQTPLKPSKDQPFMPWGFHWRTMIWIGLAWLLFITLFGPKPDRHRIDLPYSQFKQEVQQGNVAEVTVKGDRITGAFIENYQVEAEKNGRTYNYFATVVPSFGDRELMSLLETNEVVIKAEEDQRSWLTLVLINLLPWVLIIGLFAYARKRMQDQLGGAAGGGLFGFGKSKAKRYEKSTSNVRFSDVAGLNNAKQELQEIVAYLKEPARFRDLGGELPKGILLMGAPGTGKTLMARAVAGEANVPFFSISGSEFIEMFVGVGASRVRDMFRTAKQEAPAIIFIDELDSIGRARGTGLGGGHDEREQTLNQILSEMDGFDPHESVVVMAATNRPDVLDAALTRPGRFDRQITFDLPQKSARYHILRLHTQQVPVADDVDLQNLAARTVGFSGAQLKNLVNEATLLAGRHGKQRVEADDFEQARDKILLGSQRDEPLTEEEKHIVAYHEAGHALLACLLPGTDPLQKVSIIPRGRALGATEQLPEEERHNLSRTYLLNRIAVMLGGRVAEKVVLQDVTTGAGDDLKQATKVARRMVCQWGMSERLGAVAFRQGEEHVFLGREMIEHKDFSEHTARLIDEEIQRIVQSMEQQAQRLLEYHRDKLDTLARALLEEETLEAQEVDRLLGLDGASPPDNWETPEAVSASV